MSGATTLLRFSLTAVIVGTGLARAAESPEAPALGQDVPVLPLPTTGQVRVLLLRPTMMGRAIAPPEEATRAFQQAIADSTEGVVFVNTLAEATDLLQLTNYQLTFDDRGVRQTWQFSFRPLVGPDDPPAARARPGDFAFSAHGSTLSECTRGAREKLTGMLHSLLARFRPVVPR